MHKSSKTIIIVVCVIAVVSIFFMRRKLTDTSFSFDPVHEYDIATAYHEQYHVSISKTNFPDKEVRIEISVRKNLVDKEVIFNTTIAHDCDGIVRIIPLDDTKNASYYDVMAERCSLLLWRDKRDNSHHWVYANFGVCKYSGKFINLEEYAQYMCINSDWSSFHTFADYLLQKHNPVITKMVMRYADGKFTQSEIGVNHKYMVIDNVKKYYTDINVLKSKVQQESRRLKATYHQK